jgi:hypothetical protein
MDECGRRFDCVYEGAMDNSGRRQGQWVYKYNYKTHSDALGRYDENSNCFLRYHLTYQFVDDAIQEEQARAAPRPGHGASMRVLRRGGGA